MLCAAMFVDKKGRFFFIWLIISLYLNRVLWFDNLKLNKLCATDNKSSNHPSISLQFDIPDLILSARTNQYINTKTEQAHIEIQSLGA